jgi:hypothetical protein
MGWRIEILSQTVETEYHDMSTVSSGISMFTRHGLDNREMFIDRSIFNDRSMCSNNSIVNDSVARIHISPHVAKVERSCN